MHRLPGSEKTSERWMKAMEGAQQGIIAKLRILSMDVVMATRDGSDRWCQLVHSSFARLCKGMSRPVLWQPGHPTVGSAWPTSVFPPNGGKSLLR